MRKTVLFAFSLCIACGGTGSVEKDMTTSAHDLAEAAPGYTLGGPSSTVTFTSGQGGATAQIAATSAYPGSSTFTFGGTASAGGSVVLTEAFNGALGQAADVTPATLPAAGGSTSPMLYYAFDNRGSGTIAASDASLTFSTASGSIFAEFLAADISCELDWYDPTSRSWQAGASVPLAQNATSFTLPVQAGGHASFAAGQSIAAVTCD